MTNRFCSVVVLFVISLLSAATMADDEKAFKFFESGQKSYNLQDYKAALQWFEMAVEQKANDGQVHIQVSKPKYSWVDSPRGPRRKVVDDGMVYKGFYANEFLGRTRAAIAKQAKESNPPVLVIDYTLKPNNFLAANEKISAVVSIENTGGSTANNVELHLPMLPDIAITGDTSFGDITPGDTVARTLNIVASKTISDGNKEILLSASEKDGFVPKVASLSLFTEAYKSPRLKVIDAVITDMGSQRVKGTYTIWNLGKGAAKNVVANLKIPQDSSIFLLDEDKRSVNLGELAPGEQKQVSFDFYAKSTVDLTQPLPLSLHIEEKRPEFSGWQKLIFLPGVPVKVATLQVQTPDVNTNKPVLVLLPIHTSSEDAHLESIFGGALQEGLQNRFKVFYGAKVNAIIDKESNKIDCDAERCEQNVVLSFNGELIGDSSVKKVSSGYILKFIIRNVLTTEIVESKTEACRNCDEFKIVETLKKMGLGASRNIR